MTTVDTPRGERLTQRDVQFLKKLKIKKYRDETESFLAEGGNLCLEALNGDCAIQTLIYDRGRVQEFSSIIEKAEALGIPVASGTSAQFRQFTSTVTPPGIAVHVTWRKSIFRENDVSTFRRMLALDRVSDPGNMGTLLRTAEWFGIPCVLCGKDSIEATNPKVVRGSMGAVFALQIYEDVAFGDVLPGLRRTGYTIVGTGAGGVSAGNTIRPEGLQDLNRTVLILGNEAHGMSPEFRSHCDIFVSIPGTGKAESLNVAVAGGVLMYYLAST